MRVCTGRSHTGQGCQFVVSDTNAVYCGTYGSSLLSVASSGALTTLGTILGEGETADANGVALDDTEVYWIDAVTVGRIMKAPKAGGTATIVARDTSPVALAVDANAIYCSDVGGNIMRLPK